MKYGLAEFGDFDYTEINNELAKAITEVYGEDVERGAAVLADVLSELHQKAESITDGRSRGYRMFTASGYDIERRHELTKKVFSILSSVWGYDLKIEDAILSNAP